MVCIQDLQYRILFTNEFMSSQVEAAACSRFDILITLELVLNSFIVQGFHLQIFIENKHCLSKLSLKL